MAKSDLSPIILFVYNRPKHTRRTLAALEKNELARDSILYIYSDGPRTADDIPMVNKVRAIIREPLHFKEIIFIERKSNYGLAQNIIKGVSEVIKKHGKAIVFEDDLESAPYALRYFNEALSLYEKEEKVMHISGYMYPVEDTSKLTESFFFRAISSWGWATWDRAWKHFDPDIESLTKDFNKEKIKRFSIDKKENFWKQVKLYKAGKINSWAIRWYLSVFNQDGLSLYPRESMIRNIGMDGSGTHTHEGDMYKVELATSPVMKFPINPMEDEYAYQAIKHFFAHRKGDLLERAVRYIKKKL